MKWYHHHNPSVVTSTEGDSITYYEVRDGELIKGTEPLRYYHMKYIEEGTWTPLTKLEAHSIISGILGKSYRDSSGTTSISSMFTQIDIHMFSSGDANEL